MHVMMQFYCVMVTSMFRPLMWPIFMVIYLRTRIITIKMCLNHFAVLRNHIILTRSCVVSSYCRVIQTHFNCKCHMDVIWVATVKAVMYLLQYLRIC